MSPPGRHGSGGLILYVMSANRYGQWYGLVDRLHQGPPVQIGVAIEISYRNFTRRQVVAKEKPQPAGTGPAGIALNTLMITLPVSGRSPNSLNTAPRQHIFAVSGKSNFLSVFRNSVLILRVHFSLLCI